MDFSDYETPIAIRQATPADHDAIIALQVRCFPGMKPWSKKQLMRHYELFPEGQIVVETEDGVIGSSSSLRIDFDDHPDHHTFDQITGNGNLDTHDQQGPDLYGIEVMVDPDHRGMKVGERLYQARFELAEQLNLRRILIAGRMPHFAAFAGTAKEYVRAVRRQEIPDPILGFQLKQEFRPVRVLEEYLPSDAESDGRALLMEWGNLEYRPPGRRHQKASQPVRICVIQYQMRQVSGWDDFAQQTEYFVDVAANYKSDFAVFPELLTTQLLSCTNEKRPSEAVRTIPKFTERYIEHFTELAVGYNVNILGGTHIVETEDGHLENVAFLFRRDGTIDRQSKLHVTPNEARWWGIQGGSELRLLETDVGRVAINICYDVEFPELARMAADKGADILFVPYCTEDRQGHLRVRYCAQARAVENQIFVVTAGTVGNLPDSANMDIQYAQSGVFTPSDFTFPRDGIAAEATANVETVVVADLDLEMLRRVRKSGSVRPLHDRRRDLYTITEPKKK